MSAIIEETMNNNGFQRIVLIACGSFSPPTPMHFRMFEIARDHFETEGAHRVVGGIVSPTHDAYGKKGLAPAVHRFSMVKLALQSSSWIRVSDWEITQNQWSRTKDVLQHHQYYMNNFLNSAGMGDVSNDVPGWFPKDFTEGRGKVQLKLLCGADLLESFAVPGLWAEEDIEDIVANYGLVVISRSGANPEKFIFESDVLTKYKKNITLITNWIPNDVSSTLIRRLLSRQQSVKYLIDDLVIEYIKKNELFGWKSKHLNNELTNVYNKEYINQINMKKESNNARLLSEDDDEDSDIDDEQMDETDFTKRSQLNIRSRNIICCGENKMVEGAKMLLNRRLAGPGQAVQVITTERGTQPLNDNEEIHSKKMKTSYGEAV